MWASPFLLHSPCSPPPHDFCLSLDLPAYALGTAVVCGAPGTQPTLVIIPRVHHSLEKGAN